LGTSTRQDDADVCADEGGGDKGLAKFVSYDRFGEGERIAGPARRHEDPDDRVEPRPSIRRPDRHYAHVTARGTRLHQEHDQGRGADGRGDPGRECHRRAMPQTREHVLLARQVKCVPGGALNKVDAVDDQSCWTWWSWRCRELLTSYGSKAMTCRSSG